MNSLKILLCTLALALTAPNAFAQTKLDTAVSAVSSPDTVRCCSHCDGTTQFLSLAVNGATCPNGTPAFSAPASNCGTATAPRVIHNSPKCGEGGKQCCFKCVINCQKKTIGVQTHELVAKGRCPSGFEGPKNMKACNENSAPVSTEWDKALVKCRENAQLAQSECCKKLLACK